MEEYLSVLREKGPEYLETYETPRLSWDEVRTLNNGGGGLETIEEKATYHALVAGGGEGQLTEAERKGVPVKPGMDPDTERDLRALKMDREQQQQQMLSLSLENSGGEREEGGRRGGGGRGVGTGSLVSTSTPCFCTSFTIPASLPSLIHTL